jgi:cytochrome c biogenesis protein CcmG/thiol:disulfide interchange protein DsbE
MNAVSAHELEAFQNCRRPVRNPREIGSVNPRRSQSGRLKLLGLLAAVTLVLSAGSTPMMAGQQNYRAPKAPNFSIMANDGQTYTPDYLKGNVVLLYFWATWCPYCRKAVPHMNDLANEYANASFTIIGICGSKDTDSWHTYIDDHRMDWPQSFDANRKMAYLFGARGVPNFFLIDKDGYVVYHQMGWDDSMPSELEKVIDRALKEPSQ